MGEKLGGGGITDFGVEVRNGKVIQWKTVTTYDRHGVPHVERTETEAVQRPNGVKRIKGKKVN